MNVDVGASDSVQRFLGFAADYDAYRPAPPSALVGLLSQLAGGGTPRLVVDIGCGTGLATRLWSSLADHVIGIEPSEDMLRQAKAATDSENVTYQAGYSHQTGLPDGCADIVTVSQALHWMEPEPTFAEILRILRVGGVFAAVDCDWPPTMPDWRAMELFRRLFREIRQIEARHGVEGLSQQVRQWAPSGHLDRIRSSGLFGFTQEILLHGTVEGNADRLIGLVLSFGSIQTVLKHPRLRDDAIALLSETRREAERILGDRLRPWHYSYRVKVGVRT